MALSLPTRQRIETFTTPRAQDFINGVGTRMTLYAPDTGGPRRRGSCEIAETGTPANNTLAQMKSREHDVVTAANLAAVQQDIPAAALDDPILVIDVVPQASGSAVIPDNPGLDQPRTEYGAVRYADNTAIPASRRLWLATWQGGNKEAWYVADSQAEAQSLHVAKFGSGGGPAYSEEQADRVFAVEFFDSTEESTFFAGLGWQATRPWGADTWGEVPGATLPTYYATAAGLAAVGPVGYVMQNENV